MAQSLAKFFAVWLGFALAIGAGLFLLNGDSTALNPSIEDALLKNCQEQNGGFSRDQAQQCLEQVGENLLSRVVEVRSDLMYWFALNAVTVLIIGLLFMVRINLRAEVVGSPDGFRSMRGPWFAHILAIGIVSVAFATLAHFSSFFSNWGNSLTQARGWGIPAFLIVTWCVAFWLATRFATPTKMKPSIPAS